MPKGVASVLVLGGGSAGFLAALTLKARMPHLGIAVLRSPDLGIIGVGESTTTYVPEHLHGYLGLPIGPFFREVQPSWKVGIRFLWGPKPFFSYTFTFQVDRHLPGLSKPVGFFADDMAALDLHAAMMSADRVFARQPDGGPFVNRQTAYHLENERLVAYLERTALASGIQIIEDKVIGVVREGDVVRRLTLASERVIEADLFVDCSGFRSELLGKELNEPMISFGKSLYNDRAVIGGWERQPGETILPYTTAETMDAGWCWRIDHPDRVNRGYVYSSAFLSEDAAEAEFRRKNPRVSDTRVIRFVSGRRQRSWVGNVLAIGNSGGFVEPLESTALYVICLASQVAAETLHATDAAPGPVAIAHYNRLVGSVWDSIRRFLSIHFRFNTRLDTPYWRACRADADLAGAEEIVEYYQENGPQALFSPTLMTDLDPFRLEGYFTLLLGQGVPHKRVHVPSDSERMIWQRMTAANREEADRAMPVEEALRIVHSPAWNWHPDFYRQSADLAVKR